MTTEQDFQRAREDPSYRQEFLDNLDLEDATPYVRDLRYKNLKDHRGIMSIYLPFIEGIIFRDPRSIIEIYPFSFSPEETENLGDFLSVLIDHEGEHARDFHEKPFSSWSDHTPKITARRELRAIENQLPRLDGRGCSEEFKKHIDKLYSKHQETLREAA